MKCTLVKTRRKNGFSLAELVAALTIGSIIVVVVLAIYSRARASATALTERLETGRLANEVLQRIAEDLDRIVAGGSDTQITLESKFSTGFNVVRLTILTTITDDRNNPEDLRRITWQSSVDPLDGMLSVYRAHSGLSLEDPLLDSQKEPWERELFVPVCTGLTYFTIEVPEGEQMLNRWAGNKLPKGLTISISMAEPYKAPDGTWQVFEEDKTSRTIAIDRTRKINFKIAEPVRDANNIPDANQPQLPETTTQPERETVPDVPTIR